MLLTPETKLAKFLIEFLKIKHFIAYNVLTITLIFKDVIKKVSSQSDEVIMYTRFPPVPGKTLYLL